MVATTFSDIKMDTPRNGKKYRNGRVNRELRQVSTTRYNSPESEKKLHHGIQRTRSESVRKNEGRNSGDSEDLAREEEDIVPDNLLLTEIKQGANGMEGLFQRKRSSINMLTDPRILDHLRKIHHQATIRGSVSSTDTISSQVEKDQLDEKLSVYNRKMQLEVFQLRSKNSGRYYEGALRFYFEDDDQELTKAVKVDNNTSVEELIPLLHDKFNLNKDDGCEKRDIYQVVNGDEILLDKDERPLELALNAKNTPRFVLSEGPPSTRRKEIEVFDQSLSGSEPGLEKFAENSDNLNDSGGFVSPVIRRRNKIKTKQEREEERRKRRTWTGVIDGNNMNDSRFKSSPEVSPSAQIIANRRGRSVKGDRDRKRESSQDRKRSRSSSRNRLSFRFSFRKSKEVEEAPVRTELSSEDRAPGILKIFGESIVPGAKYKSVLAPHDITASEIVKQSLERYNLPADNSSQYVLCDVVGRFGEPTNESDEPEWVTEHVRVIPNNERPLVLQSLWKPQGGLCRRFELMNKSAFIGDGGYVDINDNAHSFGTSVSTDLGNSPRPSNTRTSDSNSLEGYIIQSHPRLSGVTVSNATTASVSSGHEPSVRSPAEHPFFLTLRGYNSHSDYVLYTINEHAAMIGSDRLGKQTVDICLTAPDILPQHCWVCKKPATNTTDLDSPETPTVITLAPLTGAVVYVNNRQITSVTELCPGDLIALGNHYVFLFKDPTASNEIPRDLNWMSPGHADAENKDSVVSEEELVNVTDVSENKKDENRAETLEEWQQTRNREYETAHNRLKISYEHGREDEILEQCMTIMNPLEEGFTLTPAYLFCLCVEYSAVKFTQQETRNLLLKISSLVQGAAWERTKDLASRQLEQNNGDEGAYLSSLLPDIKPIIFWMANGLEMLNFLQRNLATYIMDAHMSLPPGTRGSLVAADHEVIAVLEEVVMYTFQQTVYYLTKTLYMVLATTLDSNPFSSGERGCRGSMNDIIEVFESTFQIVDKYRLHSEITSQLFCYLFFFTNTSLFNTIMETGAGKKYYTWTKAVQIRANLDILENWAAEKGLQEEVERHFSTFSSAVNLLATPKHQLLHADWTTLRTDFPVLSPAQLQQLLGEYNLGRDKPRPRGWFPPPEEVEPALRKGEIMESFNSHPPLVLPTDGFTMDLSNDVADTTFYEYLNTINATFGIADDDVDSGLCVGPTPSSSPLAEASKMPYLAVFDDEDNDSYGLNDRYNGQQHASSASQLEHRRDVTKTQNEHTKAQWMPTNHSKPSSIWPNSGPPPRPQKHVKETPGRPSHEQSKQRHILHQYVNDFNDDIPYKKVSIVRQKKEEDSEIIISEPPNIPPKHSWVKGRPSSYNSKHPDVVSDAKVTQSSDKPKTRVRRRSPSEPPIVPATWESLYDKRKQQRPNVNADQKLTNQKNTTLRPNGTDVTRQTPAISVTPAESSRSIPLLGPPLKVSDIGSKQKNQTHYVDVCAAVPVSKHRVNGLKVMPLTTDDQVPPKSPTQTNRSTSSLGVQSPRSIDQGVSESEMDNLLHQDTMNIDDTLDTDKHDEGDTADVFIVDLGKTNKGLGLGLIDGLFTPLKAAGIYVRTLVPGAPAHKDGRLKLGDRILAVNGTSLVGADYQSAMKHIRSAGNHLRFLVAKSDSTVAMKITASTC